jgi:hypothetical protein
MVVEQHAEHAAGAPVRLATLPPPRPGHFAEREELDLAIARGTAAALELFIRRHPKSRYRPEAERRLRAIRR